MYAIAKELPELTTNVGRYMIALMRATNREVSEFADSCMIASQTVMRASRDNPMSLMEAIEVMQHNQQLITKGMMSAQEKMVGFLFDQIEEGAQALVNTIYDYDRDGEKLGGFSELEQLILSETKVNDDGVKALAALTKLRLLKVDFTEIGDAALDHFFAVLAASAQAAFQLLDRRRDDENRHRMGHQLAYLLGALPVDFQQCVAPGAHLVEQPMRIRDGWIAAPDRPGHGLVLSEAARARWSRPDVLAREEVGEAPLDGRRLSDPALRTRLA